MTQTRTNVKKGPPDGAAFILIRIGEYIPHRDEKRCKLEDIDSVNAHALFRCAVSRSMMKQLIDLMTALYENQSGQIEQSQASQRKDEEYDDGNSRL